MKETDFYNILGISKEASAEEIKGAYRRLALKYHPDTNGDDEAGERFKEINAAYSILGNKNKRQEYDLRGNSFFNESYMHRGAAGFGSWRSAKGPCNRFKCKMGRGLSACFSNKQSGMGMAFRHPFSKYHYERGEVYDIHLTRDEALMGVEKVVHIAKESKTGLIRVKTQQNLKDGDFLILKNGHPLQSGRDIYLRVRLVD
jgi:molecular chaperone DnaJ